MNFVSALSNFTIILFSASTFATPASAPTPVPLVLSAEACRLDLKDSDGFIFQTKKFDITTRRMTEPYGTTYLSTWVNGLGADDTSVFASIEIFKDESGIISLHSIMERTHHSVANPSLNAHKPSIEIFGRQITATEIAIDGFGHSKFEARDDGLKFSDFGKVNQSEIEISGSAAGLTYKISCQLAAQTSK